MENEWDVPAVFAWRAVIGYVGLTARRKIIDFVSRVSRNYTLSKISACGVVGRVDGKEVTVFHQFLGPNAVEISLI